MSSRSARRWEPYAGIAYVAFFIASVVVSNPPADKASDRIWIARYTGRAKQAGHLASGLLLLLAGLALMTFLVALWRRIAEARPDVAQSRLPIAAAAAAASLMGTGGLVMGYISGSEILGSYPLPGADLLRMSNDLGFALAGVGGSWAAAIAVATLSVQGYSADVLGARLRTAGLITAIACCCQCCSCPLLLCWRGFSPRLSRGSATRHPTTSKRIHWSGCPSTPDSSSLQRPPALLAPISSRPHRSRERPTPRRETVMIRRIAVTATALLATASIGVLASAASPVAAAPATHHTLQITAKRATEVQFESGGFTEADTARNSAGKAIGTDVLDCTPASDTKANCTGVLGLEGGVLDARLSLNFMTGAIAGTINGGTMAYSHDTGTITGSSFNGGSHLTVLYR